MERKPVEFTYKLTEMVTRLNDPGFLLVSTKKNGTSNVMTISWGMLGIIWGRPIFTVLVRPSRFTYEFIEDSGVFTVNVPPPELKRWVAICGSKSGRDIDKFGDYQVATSPARHVPTITIDACPVVYECRVVHHNDIIPAQMDAVVEADSYGGRDYHRLYFGEIVGAFAAE